MKVSEIKLTLRSITIEYQDEVLYIFVAKIQRFVSNTLKGEIQ